MNCEPHMTVIQPITRNKLMSTHLDDRVSGACAFEYISHKRSRTIVYFTL